ncbi:hypothetical protein CTA2_8620, partial [Colletotrichum tanaceti]
RYESHKYRNSGARRVPRLTPGALRDPISHEVSFEEMIIVNCQKEASSEARSSIMQNHGFEKIRATCAKATGDGFSIDKKSSAELSEAINSMFRYYEASDGRLDVPKPEWTLDASAVSPDLEVEWLHGNFAHSLGVGYKGLVQVVALGWCARATGEQEGFLLVFGNDWGHVVYETEISDSGVAIGELSAGSGPALQRAVPITQKFKHSDRVVLRLRTTAMVASFRRRGSSEEHWTLKLTTSQMARGSS